MREAGRARRRPLAPRVRYGLISYLSGHDGWRGLHLIEREQIQLLGDAIRESADPAKDLTSLLVTAPPMLLHADGDAALDAVRADPRLIPSGVSDPRSAVALPVRMVEGHVSVLDAEAFITTHELTVAAAGSENVRLHVDEVRPATPPPLAILLTDLAQHSTTPARGAFRKLLSGSPEAVDSNG